MTRFVESETSKDSNLLLSRLRVERLVVPARSIEVRRLELALRDVNLDNPFTFNEVSLLPQTSKDAKLGTFETSSVVKLLLGIYIFVSFVSPVTFNDESFPL